MNEKFIPISCSTAHSNTPIFSRAFVKILYIFILWCTIWCTSERDMKRVSGNIEWPKIKMQPFVHFWNAFILRIAFLFCLKIYKNLNNQWVWHTFLSRFIHAAQPTGTKMVQQQIFSQKLSSFNAKLFRF